MSTGMHGSSSCGMRRSPAAMAMASVLAAFISVAGRAEPAAEAASFAARYAVIDAPRDTTQPQTPPAAPIPAEAAAKPASLPDRGDGQSLYRALAAREAGQQGLPAEIAEAVMAVESGFNPAAIGGAGEIGLMQILPSTARMLGFAGSMSDLAVPETNIHFGVTYLAQAWRRAGGDLCTAVMKYRAGHGETRFSYLSVNYCLAVRAKLIARGYQVTGTVPVATFGEASAGPAPGRGHSRDPRSGRAHV